MGVKKMKTLIEYAIAVGNENRNGFNSHFTNENPFTNENRGRNELKNENRILKKNEHGNEPRFNRRNEPTLHTKFGTASVNPNSGYYTITGGNYKNKLLHRLIFEDFYGYIPDNYVIHHKDGDKLNNCILNLQLMSWKEHCKTHLHYNRDLNFCIKESKAQNTTGYFRVSISKCKQCNQGFMYRYQYRENKHKKAIFSTDLKKLEEKVKSKGLEWRKL